MFLSFMFLNNKISCCDKMEAIQDFISGSNAKNTGYSTNSSINTLKGYMNSIGDHREPETIDP